MAEAALMDSSLIVSPGQYAELVDLTRHAQDREFARARSMAAHPAGKGRDLPAEGYPSNKVLREILGERDNQAGAAELLAKITAPPLPELEETIYTVMGELASILVEIAQARR